MATVIIQVCCYGKQKDDSFVSILIRYIIKTISKIRQKQESKQSN